MQAIPVGENALVIKVDLERTTDCVKEIHRLSTQIGEMKLAGLTSIRPGLDCLMLEFQGAYEIDDILNGIGTRFIAPEDTESHHDTLEIPVCYESPFARDLNSVSETLGLKPQEIIDLHAQCTYEVWMIGFMPGYPYMGSLNEKIQLPRKSSPDLSVPAGSVAIAEEFVGVYPFDSPGGWHIIGRTPLQVVDYSRAAPFLFQYGMKVKFHPITSEEFREYK